MRSLAWFGIAGEDGSRSEAEVASKHFQVELFYPRSFRAVPSNVDACPNSRHFGPLCGIGFPQSRHSNSNDYVACLLAWGLHG
jgi:hypothetical protein